MLVVALLMGACSLRTGAPTTAPPPPGSNSDAAVFQECTSVCVRPGDCAQAFNDDGICPPGFLCALRFTCSKD